MECLILAAGQGSRLRQQGESKPLVSVLGIPLLERVIRSAMDAGALLMMNGKRKTAFQFSRQGNTLMGLSCC